MAGWHSLKRREFVRRLRALGFAGPYRGTRHEFLFHGQRRQTVPSNSDYSVPQVRMLGQCRRGELVRRPQQGRSARGDPENPRPGFPAPLPCQLAHKSSAGSPVAERRFKPFFTQRRGDAEQGKKFVLTDGSGLSLRLCAFARNHAVVYLSALALGQGVAQKRITPCFT